MRIRMCCGCNKRFEQHTLIRLKVSVETQALIPVEHSHSGRSAWVCFDIQCINTIIKNPKRLYRSLRTRPNTKLLKTELECWLRDKIKTYIDRMMADGATFASSLDKLSNTDPTRNVRYLSESVDEMSIVPVHIETISINRKTFTEIGSHHLLKKTIQYSNLLKKLKLD